MLGALTPAINVLAELRRFLGREDRGLPQIDRGDELRLPLNPAGLTVAQRPTSGRARACRSEVRQGVMVERPNNVQEVAA